MAEIGKDIVKARDLLRDGEIVAIPTETVYGLAGNALNESAILKIFEVKNRPKFDPLIAHLSSINHLETIAKEIPEALYKFAETVWPGPVTLLLKKKSVIPDLLTAGSAYIAVRIPKHPLTLDLLKSIDFPLAAPSANPFGYISPTTAQHVMDQLGNQIPYVLDGGPTQVGIESTIIGFRNEKVYVHRLGGLAIEYIQSYFPKVEMQLNQSGNPMAPGMLKSHYAPAKQLILGNLEELLSNFSGHKVGIISFSRDYGVNHQYILSPTGSLEEAAKNLFGTLRALDQEKEIDIILSEKFPNHGLGMAINDRLNRASVK